MAVIDHDPTRFNEPFFRNVGWIVNRANKLGLVMAMVVSYGDHLSGKQEKVFDASNSNTWGKLLAARYKDSAMICLLGVGWKPRSAATGGRRVVGHGARVE